MANSKVSEKEAVRNENIQETVSRTDQFFKDNKKTLWGVVIAAAVVILAVLGYSKFIYQPKCDEAMEQAMAAEMNFNNGEYELALKGDGNVLGFEQVISDYGNKSGKAVYLYAGICELNLGNFESAISYLRKYKGKDAILNGRALACQGDAYVGLEDYVSAVKCFESAAASSDNVFAATYLLKAGAVYEKLGDNAKALGCYRTVEDKYPQSIEGYDIAKYISRVSE